jgi:hypothetical protein
VFDWIAIDTTQSTLPGVSLDLSDDQTTQIVLPFTFRYYGVDYDLLSICSNGWIAMGYQTVTNWNNTAIPEPTGPAAMIAGAWYDLNPEAGTGDVYYYYDAGHHYLIVEYFRVNHWGATVTETFEFIIYDPAYYPSETGDGDIGVQYLNSLPETDVTAGIENWAQTLGIQYYFDGSYDSLAAPITDSFVICYTTLKPDEQGIKDEHLTELRPVGYLSVFPTITHGHTTIYYSLGTIPSDAHMAIYDAAGRAVKQFTIRSHDAIVWDGSDDRGISVPAGIYFVRLAGRGVNLINKIIRLK